MKDSANAEVKSTRGYKYPEAFYCSQEDLSDREYWTAHPTKSYVSRSGHYCADSRRYRVVRYFEVRPYKYQL